jgi:multidrug efflux pump subunit AcrB
MIAWFARNHVAANLLMLAIILAGLFSVFRLTALEIFPEFELDVVIISVTQRAAAPEDMETGVTSKIEEAIADLPGIKKLTSRSGEQSSQIYAEVMPGTDPRKLLNDVKSRVDALSTLPPSAERPVISLPLLKREVLSLVISGDIDEKELNLVARRIRDEVVRHPGITQTEIEGVRPYEIGIEIPEHYLRQYGLTLNEVANAINGQSLDLSAGRVRSASGEILLRAKAQAYHYHQFADIAIKRFKDGSSLLLSDIARIDDGFEEDPIMTRFNGLPAAVVNVFRVGDESAISVSVAVNNYLEKNKHKYPANVNVDIWDDDSKIVEARLDTLLTSAWQGALLVAILLALFLRPVIAFWVVAGIPVCFLGAAMLFPVMGLTFNVLSLFGFILVLGIVVDDAIVTGENIYSHYRDGADGLTAAIEGTQEIAVPVTFGILTTVVAFVPFLFLGGRTGILFGQIAYVVIPVLLFSLVESKLVLPAHLKSIKPFRAVDGSWQGKLSYWQQKIANGFESVILKKYQPALKWAITHKYITLLVFTCLTVITVSLVSNGWTRFVFFPRIQSEEARGSLTMQVGTPLETTKKAIERMEQAAFDLREKYRDSDTGESVINDVLSTVGARGGGSGQSNLGQVRFAITPAEVRTVDVTTSQLVREWRKLIGPIAGADEVTYRAEFGRPGDPINVQLTSNDFNQLTKLIEVVKAKLAEYEGVFDISDSLNDGKQELHIRLLPEAELLGFNLQQVTQQVRDAFYGSQAQRIQRARDDIRVMVRYPQNERSHLTDLDNLLILSDSGAEVRFSDIATLSWGRAPSRIYHVEQARAVNVLADVDKTSVNLPLLRDDLKKYLDQLMLQYPEVNHSFEGEAEEERNSFQVIIWGSVLVLFAIYALLAIPLASYSQPMIVMFVIPFSMVGAIAGHWIMGMDMSMMSILGMLALTGVVVNDSLVLVTYINQRIAKGEQLYDAVVGAGRARFRPVILTSLTTFMGLLPLLFEKSTQAQFMIPMAVSLGFGILFATFITLLMIPCQYLILDQIKTVLRSFQKSAAVTQ